MRYALMIYAEPGLADRLSDEERDAVYAEFLTLEQDPHVVGATQLGPVETATSVRVTGVARW
ncbi:hypothetical protein GCM10029964_098440 [Kibdelosporangium lantanae]